MVEAGNEEIGRKASPAFFSYHVAQIQLCMFAFHKIWKTYQKTARPKPERLSVDGQMTFVIGTQPFARPVRGPAGSSQSS